MWVSLAEGIPGPLCHPSLPDAETVCGTAVSCQVPWVPGHEAHWMDGFLALVAFTAW